MLEKILKAIVEVGNNYVWSFPESLPWLVVFLLGTGIFITFKMGWMQIRYVKHSIDVIRGKYDNPEDEGDINHFQALTTALSATVGIGNIAGVATAIHYGGPGAIFWMWVTAVFGMALKFAECTLSMHYRQFDDKGNASGGPMYYIEKGLGKKWKWMAITFAFLAIICSFGSGNMNQANTVAVSAYSDFLIPGWQTGMAVAFLVGLIILGGIKRIGTVTSKLVPIMAAIYILGAIGILIINIHRIPATFIEIFKSAFNPSAGLGGTTAGVFSLTLVWGIKRGLYSNEAGQGSAPIAHAAAKTKEPVREGIVAMLEPLIDTLIICSITAFVIILTGVWDTKKTDCIVPLETKKVSIYYCLEPDNIKEKDIYEAIEKDFKDTKIQKFHGTEEIKEGNPNNLIFMVDDGIIENAELMQKRDLKSDKYNGTLTVTEKGKVLDKDKKEITIYIKGAMLQNSSALTAYAFSKGLSGITNYGNYIVTIAVFLFALSTIISWSYYGERCVVYLFGTKFIIIYRFIYIAFTFLGTILTLETVWAYGDMALGLMTIPNLLAIILLSNVVLKLTKDYIKNHKKTQSNI